MCKDWGIRGSYAMVIPKRLFQQLGLVDQVELSVEGEVLVQRKPEVPVRVGWADATKAIAFSGDDALVLPEFANEGDAGLLW